MRVESVKRNICCLFAIIILFLGMCVDIVEADSFFSLPEYAGETADGKDFRYDASVLADAHLSSAQTISNIGAVCTNEMLGRSKIVQVRTQYLRGNGRERYHNILSYLIAGAILQYLFLLQTTEYYENREMVHSDTVTIAYIHRKDGEK